MQFNFFFFVGTILDHSIEARVILLLVPLNILAQHKVNEKKERRMEEEAQCGGKSKGNPFGGGGGWVFVALFNQWLQKFKKKYLCVSGDQKQETLLGMCQDSTTQEQKANKVARQMDVQSVG